jgi:hypothetical protein
VRRHCGHRLVLDAEAKRRNEVTAAVLGVAIAEEKCTEIFELSGRQGHESMTGCVVSEDIWWCD